MTTASQPVRLERLTPMLTTPQASECVAFYRRYLGFELVYCEPDLEDLTFAVLVNGDARLMLKSGDEPTGGAALWLSVSDIARLHAELTEAGLEPGALSCAHYRVWEFGLSDPDGRQLWMIQEPPAPGLEVPPLFDAIVAQDVDRVKAVLTEDPSQVSRVGWYWGWERGDWTAIQVAAGVGSPEIVSALVAAGADPSGGDPVDDAGWSPLHFAALRNPRVVSTLLEHGATDDASCAAAMGRIDALKAFLSADPGSATRRSSGGATPLHFAAARGQDEAMELLKAHGADSDARDHHYDRTPAEWGASTAEAREAIARLLRGQG